MTKRHPQGAEAPSLLYRESAMETQGDPRRPKAEALGYLEAKGECAKVWGGWGESAPRTKKRTSAAKAALRTRYFFGTAEAVPLSKTERRGLSDFVRTCTTMVSESVRDLFDGA